MFRRMRNTNLRQFGLVVTLFMVVWGTNLQAAWFMKFDGVDGESTAVGHEGEVEIDAISWGVVNTPVVGTGGTGKAVAQDLAFATRMSKASPQLMLACCTGQHIPTVTLVAERSSAGGAPARYLKITLTDVIVSSYQTGGSSGDVVPTDQISLNFSKIIVHYKDQKADGTLAAGTPVGYDLKKLEAI